MVRAIQVASMPDALRAEIHDYLMETRGKDSDLHRAVVMELKMLLGRYLQGWLDEKRNVPMPRLISISRTLGRHGL